MKDFIVVLQYMIMELLKTNHPPNFQYRFCEPLMDSFSAGTVSKGEDHNRMVTNSLDSQEDEMNFTIKWRIPKAHKGADILRKLFSRFIKEIVEGMIGYVRLPTIMSKLLSDNGSQEFGDFKFTILGMLSTYGFERRILVQQLYFNLSYASYVHDVFLFKGIIVSKSFLWSVLTRQ